MTNKYYQKIKKSSEKKHVKDIKNTKKENIKIFLKKKRKKSEKRPEKDIKIFLRNKSISYLSI